VAREKGGKKGSFTPFGSPFEKESQLLCQRPVKVPSYVLLFRREEERASCFYVQGEAIWKGGDDVLGVHYCLVKENTSVFTTLKKGEEKLLSRNGLGLSVLGEGGVIRGGGKTFNPLDLLEGTSW